MHYKIVEIFESIQGEGLQSGRLATFVRLAGCNLRCPWCDTPESLSFEDKNSVELEELMELIRKTSRGKFVVVTGGEPLLQDISLLLEGLQREGFEVAIESNGTLPLPGKIKWLTVSPKPPHYRINPDLIGKISELKLVVDDNLSLEKVQELWRLVGKETPVILQPESCRQEKQRMIMDWLKIEPQWRMGVQLHKLLGVQ